MNHFIQENLKFQSGSFKLQTLHLIRLRMDEFTRLFKEKERFLFFFLL